MTLPNERLRALHWCCETLAELASDATLADAVRASAQALLRRQPTPQDWSNLLASGGPMTTSLADALRDARAFLIDVVNHVEISEQTRSMITYTLRHCPDQADVVGLHQAVDLNDYLAE